MSSLADRIKIMTNGTREIIPSIQGTRVPSLSAAGCLWMDTS